MPREFMPILRHPEFKLPWALLAPHEKQAMTNHGQTLERLAERGGLGFSEALAIMCDLGWRYISGDEDQCRKALEALVQKRTADGVKGTVRRFTGVGHLERTGYIPAGSAAEREAAAGVRVLGGGEQ